MASFASAENLVFALFISKCCHLGHNVDNHSKPTPDVNVFLKFLLEGKSFLISLAAFELLKFEKWPQAVLGNHNFGEESSPVLSYSTSGLIKKFWENKLDVMARFLCTLFLI